MNTLKIDLKENRSAYDPGEEIAGSVSWSGDPAPQKAELRLFWFTRGKGTEDAGVIDTAIFDHPGPQETRSFSFRLPEAPYSFSGSLISLVWALELIAYPSKEVVRCEIEMGPGGHEVRLESVPTPAREQSWLSIQRR